MDLRIGFWQIIELSFLVFVIYRGFEKHDTEVWGKKGVDTLTKLMKKENFPALIWGVVIAETFFWFFVISMGGIAGWAMALYVVITVAMGSHQATSFLKNLETAKINVYSIIFRQIIYQSILIGGGFYTQVPLINF